MPRLLAIHCHPDDLEFLCAGTLALLADRGWSLHMATMTPGDCGSADRSAEEISTIRRREAAAAADVIKAEYTCLEERDLCIFHEPQTQRKVTELLRRVRPNVVITGSLQDYMADHEVTSYLVRNACFNAPIKNYETMAEHPAPPLDEIPTLYYTDALEGMDVYGDPIPPHFYVDITETFETKRNMLACHESQRSWLLAHHGVDEYLLAMERWAAKRGSEIGVQYAEAYRQHRGHAYPHENILAKELNGLVHDKK